MALYTTISYAGFVNLKTTYPALQVYYTQPTVAPNTYFAIVGNGSQCVCNIFSASDVTNFETNYLPSAIVVSAINDALSFLDSSVSPTITQDVNLTRVGGTAITEGQKVMASSLPVVIASDQSSVPITLTANSKATYSATVTGLVAVATPTDIFTITGSGTKTVRILRVSWSVTASLGTVFDLVLLKRSTANSAGTSTTRTSVPHDSINAAATATVRAYTANPTLGILAGNIDSVKTIATTASPTNPSKSLVIREFNGMGQPIVLRGTA